MAIRRPLLITVAILTFGISTWPVVRRHLRRLISLCGRCMLRLRSRAYPVERDSVVLVIAPHEDDETLGCGGLMMLKRIEGATVRVAYITDGSGSHPNHPTIAAGALAAIRKDEARNAMALLGVDSAGLRFLGASDGTLARLDPADSQRLVHEIADEIRQVAPDEIFLPCRKDGSSEHDATFRLVEKALGQTGLRPRILEYPVWSWWNPLLLLNPFLTSHAVWRMDFRGYEMRKREALSLYTTQTEPSPPWTTAVLSREFVSFFISHEEYFFER